MADEGLTPQPPPKKEACLETLPTEILFEILRYMIPIGKPIVIDPYHSETPWTMIPSGTLNMARASKKFAGLVFKLLYTDRWIKVGTNYEPVDPIEAHLDESTSSTTKWQIFRNGMPKRQAIDSPTDCVAILANMTAAGEFMTHLSLSIDYTSMRDFCDPRCARTLKTLPLLRVLEIILCPWVAQKVSLGKFNSPDILGLAEELTHVRQVLIANTVVFDDMSVGRKGLWQLAAKLRQRNQNWEANRKLNKVGEHSEATLDDKAQADSDETLDDVARTDSDETLDDVARADTDETVDDVADAEVYIKVEEP